MSYTSGLFAQAARKVQQDDIDGVPENTRLAYARKQAEFKEYCRTVFGFLDYPETVTEEKVFGFVFYHAYRARRKRGRKKKNDGVQERIFDVDDFNAIMAKYNSDSSNNENRESQLYEGAEDPVGLDVVNHALCACLRLLTHQQSQNANNLTSEQIRSERVTQLIRVVDGRKKKVKKARYDEKIDHMLSPYMNVQNIERIEDFLFAKNRNRDYYHIAALRDRYCFLMTHGGVLRGESLFKCELSDLCNILKCDEGVQACQILIMQIATGKTNGNKTLYGRVIRNKNVAMCPIGALGFYLMARFHLTGELSVYDFGENQSWFDVKLLTDCTKPMSKKSITDQAYAKTMKNACGVLEISSKHFVHFGRSSGAVDLELKEVDPDYIKMLGNWNLNVREDRYSAKLPLKAMRAMAGHSQARGGYFLPRNTMDPPQELRDQVFPFLENAIKTVDGKPERTTARAFFDLLLNLQCVVLQDAAMLLHKGRKHKLFSLPVFRTQLFRDYQEALVAKVMVVETRAGSDTSMSIRRSMDVALPGFRDRLHNIHSEICNLSRDYQRGFQRLEHSVTELRDQQDTKTNQIIDFMQHVFRHPLIQQVAAPTATAAAGVDAATRTRNLVVEKRKTLCRTHASVSSMWNEWFGLGAFEDADFPGGIEELEKKSRNKWRKHYNAADQKQFSRLKYITEFVKGRVAAGESLEAVLKEGDEFMATTNKKTLSTLHKHLVKAKSFSPDAAARRMARPAARPGQQQGARRPVQHNNQILQTI